MHHQLHLMRLLCMMHPQFFSLTGLYRDAHHLCEDRPEFKASIR
jgi:hypothetical protein